MHGTVCTLGLSLTAAAALVLAGCGDDGGGTSKTTGTTSTSTAPSNAADSLDAPEGGNDDLPNTDADGTAASSGGPGSTAGSTAATDTADTGSDTDTGDDTTGGKVEACADTWPEWINGTACGDEPALQVHQVSPDTVIVRQSLCTNFEAPFIYMLFGTDRVLIEDTGAGGVQIAETVNGVIDQWLARRGRKSIDVVVVNSHAHGDHVQGNAQFQGLPSTEVVGTGVNAVSDFFGIDTWPTQTVQYDLGGRIVDIIPIPGHQSSHIAIYDHGENWLLTGDTLYPGRLYIDDFAQYVESINKLVDHVEPLPLCQVMGTHIEMTNTPGDDFPFGAPTHPDEHPLQLTGAHLTELRDAVNAMGGNAVYEEHDDFIIFP